MAGTEGDGWRKKALHSSKPKTASRTGQHYQSLNTTNNSSFTPLDTPRVWGQIWTSHRNTVKATSLRASSEGSLWPSLCRCRSWDMSCHEGLLEVYMEILRVWGLSGVILFDSVPTKDYFGRERRWVFGSPALYRQAFACKLRREASVRFSRRPRV